MNGVQNVKMCHILLTEATFERYVCATVTSDLSGFGDFMMQLMDDHENVGVYVVNRKDKNFDQAADQLADILFQFVTMSRRERIMQRNKVENISDVFDWTNLRSYYDTAHDLAVKKKGIGKS